MVGSRSVWGARGLRHQHWAGGRQSWGQGDVGPNGHYCRAGLMKVLPDRPWWRSWGVKNPAIEREGLSVGSAKGNSVLLWETLVWLELFAKCTAWNYWWAVLTWGRGDRRNGLSSHQRKEICQTAVQTWQVEQERPLDLSMYGRGQGIQIGGAVPRRWAVSWKFINRGPSNSGTVCGT